MGKVLGPQERDTNKKLFDGINRMVEFHSLGEKVLVKKLSSFVLYTCTTPPPPLAYSLATILLYCPRNFARWRSIINHQLLPPSLLFHSLISE